MNEKLSVIIPSRNSPYIQKTIDDISEKAVGPIEIIVVLDGYWPNPALKANKNLIIVHSGAVKSVRVNVNAAARIATGKYIMKSDDHCMYAEGFDEALKADCEENWIAIPSRYSLDVKNWKRKDKPPIEYLYLTYPYATDDIYGIGFNGRKLTGKTQGMQGYYEPENKFKDKLIDDIMIFQGSCWFMHKKHFKNIDYYNEKFPNMWQESTEICFKTWLSGGRVVRNKKTWYAHFHKNPDEGGRWFNLSKREMNETKTMAVDYWMNNSWPKQTKDIKWLIDKFSPLPGWPDNWAEEIGYFNPTASPSNYDNGLYLTTSTPKPKKTGVEKMTLTNREVNQKIKDKFRTKRGDVPPFTGWLKPSTREDLYDVMNECGCFKTGIEVGVGTGVNAEIMLNKIKGLNLCCVDPWTKYARWSQEKIDSRYNRTVKRLKPYGSRVKIIRKTSMDAVGDIPDGSLDFVYIDGFHDFDWVMADLIFWSPKVRKDGIVAGHDYYPFYRGGVITAVDAYVKAHDIKKWYVSREEEPSFFWVK
jgi:glycosyltransferase involved in cell wall biosynthesis